MYDTTMDPCSPDFDARSWSAGSEFSTTQMLRALPGWLARRAHGLLANNRCGEPIGFRAETVDDPDRPGYVKVRYWELLGTTGSLYVDPHTARVERVRATHALPVG